MLSPIVGNEGVELTASQAGIPEINSKSLKKNRKAYPVTEYFMGCR